MQARKTPSVPALERGLHILELIAQSKSGLTFAQIARHVDFPKSSVHCILLTLEREGYLHRSAGTGRFSCGTKLVQVTQEALQGTVLGEVRGPLLVDLMQRTRLTAHMALLEAGVAIIVAKADHAMLQRIATWVGKPFALHCTSVGKCLTAWLPDEELKELISARGLQRYNDNTISTMARLRRELEAVRQQGWAIDDEEEEIGVRCIGVPVWDAGPRPVAAISVTGTVAEIPPERIPLLVSELNQTAKKLSENYANGAPRND